MNVSRRQRHQVLLRVGRDPGARSGPSQSGRAAGGRVLAGEDLGADRGRSRRDLAHRPLRPRGDILLHQRGAARLRAARTAARPRRALARPANHPCGLDQGGHDCAPKRSAEARLPASATAIRPGYSRASGGCSRSAASVARRSTSIRPVGSSWSTQRSANSPAIRASGKRTRSGGASCNSSAIEKKWRKL